MTSFSTRLAAVVDVPDEEAVQPAPDCWGLAELPPPQADPPRKKRGLPALDRRTRSILALAAAAAVLVNAGAAWAYWRITESQTGIRPTGAEVELMLRARSDYSKPLTPGQTGNLSVTLTNDYDFPIKITRVIGDAGNAIVDAEHRGAGCQATAVVLTRDAFDVTWRVPRNTVGAFTVPGGLAMARDAGPACSGATFSVPIRVHGVSSR
jgi:hypothetical protein